MVEEGLSPGERVITAGQYRVQPGPLVAPRSRTALREGPALNERDGISAPFIRYPDRHLAADGRHPVRRPRRLSAAAGGAAAAGGFPDHPGVGQLPGASPETMASSVAQPLERQFAQIPGVAQMTSTSSSASPPITVQFDLNRNIDGAANDIQAAINAASGQLPKNLPSPPTYRKVNPADSPILLLSATFGHAAADRGRRQRRRPARPADQPDLRRRPRSASAASRSRRSASSSIRPSWWPRACRWRTCARRSPSPPSTAPRAASTAPTRAYTIYANDQLTRPRRTGTTSSSPIATARRCASATSARPSTGPEDAKQAAWANGKRGVFLVDLQAARRQRHRDRRSDQGEAAAAAAPRCRRRSRSRS